MARIGRCSTRHSSTQVRYAGVPLVFADSRKLAEDYTFRFLAAALQMHGDK